MRIAINNFVPIIIAFLCIIACNCNLTRDKKGNNEFNCIENICIRVLEYKVRGNNDIWKINGKVELKNNRNENINGNTLYRVLAKDIDGNIFDTLRDEDEADLAWFPYKIKAGISETRAFDGFIWTKKKIVEFSVRWDGNKSVVTKWIKI